MAEAEARREVGSILALARRPSTAAKMALLTSMAPHRYGKVEAHLELHLLFHRRRCLVEGLEELPPRVLPG
jgi:hypothetical protein